MTIATHSTGNHVVNGRRRLATASSDSERFVSSESASRAEKRFAGRNGGRASAFGAFANGDGVAPLGLRPVPAGRLDAATRSAVAAGLTRSGAKRRDDAPGVLAPESHANALVSSQYALVHASLPARFFLGKVNFSRQCFLSCTST